MTAKEQVERLARVPGAFTAEKWVKHLKEAAQKAGVDISVTEAFVERWRQGRLYESPCRD